MNHIDKKWDELISFLDRKAFDPILSRSDQEFADLFRSLFRDVRRSTEKEKRHFHENYFTAEEVKRNYLRDLNSITAQKETGSLGSWDFHSFLKFKEEFLDLCERLGV